MEPNEPNSLGPRATPSRQDAPSIVIQQSSGGWSRWFAWLGWLGLLICIPLLLGLAASYRDYFNTDEGIREKYHSLSRTAKDKVAVIQAVGILAIGDGFVKQQIDRVRQDDHVQAVVLRVDSPGGTVTASDYLYHHLSELCEERKLPLVVSMGGIAASGGYYISMAVGDQERSIFAEPTTTTGSIGVIIPHYNISRLLEKHDIRDDSIVSHPRKQLLSMTREATPEDRKILQRYVDQSFERFKSIVKSGRPRFREDEAALDELATGEIFTAEQAQRAGLVDEVGFVEDAVKRAIELAALDPDEVRVVTFEKPVTLRDVVGLGQAQRHSLEDSLLRLSVPQAYYLFTTLPGLTR